MRIMVTGGCGFIGSHFIRLLLNERPETRVLNLDALTYAGDKRNVADLRDDSRYEFVQCHITDVNHIDGLMRTGFDAIVNFAAESHVDRSLDSSPAEFIRTNLTGTTVLLEAVRKHKVARFLQVSTDEVYGDVPGGSSSSETDALRPNNPYSVTKAAADQMTLAYVRSFGVNAVITRSSNNYGPNQYPEKFIPVVITKALRDEPIPVYGDGQQVRDWLYVEDNCRGILSTLERGEPGGIYNLGASNHHPNLEIAQRILAILGKPDTLIRFVSDRPGHDRRYDVNWCAALKRLGWIPRKPFDEGLRETVDWYRGRA
jgi:dTDP-glucose 4,6-dehydratase